MLERVGGEDKVYNISETNNIIQANSSEQWKNMTVDLNPEKKVKTQMGNF